MRFPVLVAAVGVCSATAVAPARAQSGAAHVAIDTTITVRARTSTLEFDPPAIAARHGTRVRIRFSNMGTLPHNFVVVRDDNDIDELAAAASKMGGDYVPVALKAKMIAYSTLASPGQTVEVTFVMPPAGEYTYVCLMSGHANSMLGRLRSLR
ncbi:MAG: plastocyanin/azurin family copper-binding protein [bacterium]